MDPTHFDTLTRRLGSLRPHRTARGGLLGRALSRRRGLAAVVTALAGLVGLTVAEPVTAQPGADAKPCLKNGTRCHRHSGGAGDPCRRCCSGHSQPRTGVKGRRCACVPAGKRCRQTRQCCGTRRCQGGACVEAGPACDVCASGCAFTSVQAAIDAADADATITLCAGTYNEDLFIDKDLTLVGAGDGAGVGNTSLQGTGGTSVVVIDNRTVTLRQLRITGGGGNLGGGIHKNAGTLTLTDCTITGNTATLGAGIFNNAGGTLTLTNTAVTDNTATLGGGGILNTIGGTVTLTNTNISGNTADDGGGLLSRGTLTLDAASSVTGNHATNASATGGLGAGGIRNRGTVSCAAATVTGNTAGDPPVASDCVDANGEGTGCATCNG